MIWTVVLKLDQIYIIKPKNTGRYMGNSKEMYGNSLVQATILGNLLHGVPGDSPWCLSTLDRYSVWEHGFSVLFTENGCLWFFLLYNQSNSFLLSTCLSISFQSQPLFHFHLLQASYSRLQHLCSHVVSDQDRDTVCSRMSLFRIWRKVWILVLLQITTLILSISLSQTQILSISTKSIQLYP